MFGGRRTLSGLPASELGLAARTRPVAAAASTRTHRMREFAFHGSICLSEPISARERSLAALSEGRVTPRILSLRAPTLSFGTNRERTFNATHVALTILDRHLDLAPGQARPRSLHRSSYSPHPKKGTKKSMRPRSLLADVTPWYGGLSVNCTCFSGDAAHLLEGTRASRNPT